MAESPSMANFQFKLLQIVRRHEQMKTAFNTLKSQIKTGLLEAEDVFSSLSVPLMRLVGIKTEEMAEEGRSSTIFMESSCQQVYQRNVSGSETRKRSPFPAKCKDQLHRLEAESYSYRATNVGKQLIEKQRLQLQQLVYLLQRIESVVNSQHDNILQTLDNHRVSLHKFFQKSILYLSTINQTNQNNKDTLVITLKLLRAIFGHVGSALESIEGGVEDLMHELAEHMCAPMVEYVQGLKANMAASTLLHLISIVEEMEEVMRDESLKLEEARKKMRVEEERKLEALSRLREAEEKRRAMKEFIGLLIEAKKSSKGPFVPHKLLSMEEDKVGDEKLIWDLLKEKNKIQSQASPIGTKDLLHIQPKKIRNRKLRGDDNISTWIEPTVNRMPITRRVTRSYTRGLGRGIQSPECWPRVGSSPSMVD